MIAKPFTPEKGVESFGIMKNPPGADPRRPNKSLVPRGAGLGAFGAEPGQLIADDLLEPVLELKQQPELVV